MTGTILRGPSLPEGSFRLGLFGGSFDPIHRGHIEPVRAARERLGLERVLYLPTARPPHKRGDDAPRMNAAVRFALVELALLDEEGLYASTAELADLAGDGGDGVGPAGERPQYTVETLELFRRLVPEAELHLLIGADSLAQLESWRRWQELPELAHLVALARPGWDLEAVLSAGPEELRQARDRGRLTVVEDVHVALSSTEIRHHLSQTLSRLLSREEGSARSRAERWLPPRVLDYVLKYRLYR